MVPHITGKWIYSPDDGDDGADNDDDDGDDDDDDDDDDDGDDDFHPGLKLVHDVLLEHFHPRRGQ